MTLDCNIRSAIKGHFCSLLISNIFSNPLFLLNVTLLLTDNTSPNTKIHSFSMENTTCSNVLSPNKVKIF